MSAVQLSHLPAFPGTPAGLMRGEDLEPGVPKRRDLEHKRRGEKKEETFSARFQVPSSASYVRVSWTTVHVHEPVTSHPHPLTLPTSLPSAASSSLPLLTASPRSSIVILLFSPSLLVVRLPVLRTSPKGHIFAPLAA